MAGTTIDLAPPWPRRSDGGAGAAGDRRRFPRDRRRCGGARTRRAQLGARCCRSGENWGQRARGGFRRAGRGHADPADPRHRISRATSRRSPRPTATTRGSPSGSRPTSTAGRSPTPSPSSTTRRTSASASRRRCRRARARRRGGAASRRGLRHRARIRHAALRRARHRHRPAGDAADRQPVDPRRHRFPDDAAQGLRPSAKVKGPAVSGGAFFRDRRQRMLIGNTRLSP